MPLQSSCGERLVFLVFIIFLLELFFFVSIASRELVTKQCPFNGWKPVQIIWFVAGENRRLPLPEDCPPFLRDLIEGSGIVTQYPHHENQMTFFFFFLFLPFFFFIILSKVVGKRNQTNASHSGKCWQN
jgi:hypothetical protein